MGQRTHFLWSDLVSVSRSLVMLMKCHDIKGDRNLTSISTIFISPFQLIKRQSFWSKTPITVIIIYRSLLSVSIYFCNTKLQDLAKLPGFWRTLMDDEFSTHYIHSQKFNTNHGKGNGTLNQSYIVIRKLKVEDCTIHVVGSTILFVQA